MVKTCKNQFIKHNTLNMYKSILFTQKTIKKRFLISWWRFSYSHPLPMLFRLRLKFRRHNAHLFVQWRLLINEIYTTSFIPYYHINKESTQQYCTSRPYKKKKKMKNKILINQLCLKSYRDKTF